MIPLSLLSRSVFGAESNPSIGTYDTRCIELNAAYSDAWRPTNLFRSVIIAISRGLALRITANGVCTRGAEIAESGSWGEPPCAECENRKLPPCVMHGNANFAIRNLSFAIYNRHRIPRDHPRAWFSCFVCFFFLSLLFSFFFFFDSNE